MQIRPALPFSKAPLRPQLSPVAPSPVREPERKVSNPYDFGPDASWGDRLKAKLELVSELWDTLSAPGKHIGRLALKAERNIRRLREKEFSTELAIPSEGIRKTSAGYEASDIPNPNDAEGRFDPYALMPQLIFHSKEDSFPVRPDHDGDGDLLTDAGHYRHGVVGGNQPLEGSFSVARKGEYTVLTYSLYYVDNKAGNYHLKDSSTFAIYLKPGADGKLEPKYLYSSWHHGANMAPWKDLKKDQQGRPILLVERGSHALLPLGHKDSMPKGGLRVDGQGRLSAGDKALPNRLRWMSPQSNVRNARHIEPSAHGFLMDAYYKHYPERINPIHPLMFGYR